MLRRRWITEVVALTVAGGSWHHPLPSALAAEKLTDKVSRAVGLKSAEPADYPKVGDDTTVDGLLPMKVEGIGLVVGLKGTGSDPPPNRYREAMFRIMKNANVADPQGVLASPDTAIVLLRAFIPPGIRKGEMVDVEVWVPPGDTTTSLKGGRLLEAELSEQVIAKGDVLAGDKRVSAKGLVLCLEGEPGSENVELRKGKILGQGRVVDDHDFRLVLHREARSGVKSRILSEAIGRRFYEHLGGKRVGMAYAKNDQFVHLKLARQYRFDIQRYLLVVRRVPVSDSQTLRQAILERQKEDLKDPAKTLEAALRLEAIGSEATPVLKEGLESPSEFVNFASAQALAYIGNAAGVDTLTKLALDSPDYRAYALSALASLDHPSARISLSKLLNAKGSEVRYGAFRAMWASDRRDAIITGEEIGEEFSLHCIPTTAEPMVHISRTFRREIVLFNEGQKLLTPFNLFIGNHLMVQADEGADRAFLFFVRTTADGPQRRAMESSLQLSEIIRKAAQLGATYPDVVELLQKASANGALTGRLEINALPRALPLDTLSAIAAGEPNERPARPAENSSQLALFEDPNQGQPLVDTTSDPDNEPAEKDVPEKQRKGWFNRFRLLGN